MVDPVPESARVTEILSVARELLESDGWDAVTMRAVAERMGIRAPSLYKHVAGKDELRTALVAVAFTETAEVFSAAIDSAVDAAADGAVDGVQSSPLGALALAYRRWAQEHPHLYRLMTDGPLDRDALPDGVEDAAAEPLVRACGGDGDLARATWAFAHGMTILELDGRFPPGADLDEAWRRGIDAFATRSFGPHVS